MVSRIVIALVALSAAKVRAEPEPRGTVGVGVGVGVLARVNGLGLAGVDGTWRYSGDAWLHVVAASSVTFADVISSVAEVRVGLEHRRHDCGWGCLYGGVDLAFLDGDIHEGPGPATGHARGLVAVPRGGIDLGGETLRFRLGLELLLGEVRRDRTPDLGDSMGTTTTSFATGFALTGGFAAQF